MTLSQPLQALPTTGLAHSTLRETGSSPVCARNSPRWPRGVAWSGVAPIERVEVNTGGAWHQASLIGEPSRQAWQRWELVTRIEASGPAKLRARAMDCAGRAQPEHAEWNRLGYGNNSIHEVAIRVV